MFWNQIIVLIFVFIQLSLYVSCLPEDTQVTHPFPISVRNGPENGIIITISDISLSPSAKCSLMYRCINNSQAFIRLDYAPQMENYTVELNNLQPHTTYDLYMFCQENGAQYQSKHRMFTTAGDKTDTKKIINSPPPSFSATVSPDGSTEFPNVQRERVYGYMNPVDVAAGILFGAMGLGILGAIGYYFGKKLRQRQRVQRFLQYRQQENDPFPVLEQTEDDNLYV